MNKSRQKSKSVSAAASAAVALAPAIKIIKDVINYFQNDFSKIASEHKIF